MVPPNCINDGSLLRRVSGCDFTSDSVDGGEAVGKVSVTNFQCLQGDDGGSLLLHLC